MTPRTDSDKKMRELQVEQPVLGRIWLQQVQRYGAVQI